MDVSNGLGEPDGPDTIRANAGNEPDEAGSQVATEIVPETGSAAGPPETQPTMTTTPVLTPAPAQTAAVPTGAAAKAAFRRTPFFEAMQAARYQRQILIREIEDITLRKLICYIADPNAFIDKTDAPPMVDLLHNITPGTPIDLMIHTPGGDIDAAEKLITLVRNRAGGREVRVLVPDFAKSAGTLIALGADKVLMGDASELGAIDPQVMLPDSQGVVVAHSAQNYLDAFAEHAEALRRQPGDPVAALMLSKMEPAIVRKLERMMDRSRAIAEDLLSQAMVRDAKQARKIAKGLNNTKKWHSHGQMISHSRAKGAGLAVEYMGAESELWSRVWRLYCLQITSVVSRAKLFESDIASLMV